MAAQFKNNKIDTLQPSKLSQSIKSRPDQDRTNGNVFYQGYFTNNRVHTEPNEGSRNFVHHTKTTTYQLKEQRNPGAAFKKIKPNTDKLNELKKQYQILRNLKIDDSFVYSQKNQKRLGSSVDASQKSLRSSKSIHNSTKIKNQSQGIIQYQKKQLQLMLANSMNKIQQLLKSQVEYKKKIYELSRTPVEEPSSRFQEQIRLLKRAEKNNLQIIDNLRNQQDKLRKLNFNLTQRIRSIESENYNLQIQSRRANQEKRRLQENLLLEKQANMTVKIDVKRFQLEKQMIERQKNSEVQRLKRTIKDLTTQRDRERQRLNNKVNAYQQEINDLTIKLSTYAKQAPKTRQRSEQKYRQKYREKEKFKPQVEGFQKKLAEKLKQLQNAEDEQARREINNLRAEIEHLTESNVDAIDKVGLERRIAALQQVINEDNEQKMKFLDQLNRMIKDFQDLQNENYQLKNRLRKAQKQQEILKQSTAYQIDKLQKSQRLLNVDQYSQQIHNYLAKLRRLQAQNKDLKSKISNLQSSQSNSDSKTTDLIRQYSRRLQQSELQIQKLLKQNQLNLEISNSKFKGEIQIAKNETAMIARQRNEQRARQQSIRRNIQAKYQNLKKQHEEMLRSYNEKLRAKDHEVEQARASSQQLNARTRQDYEKQLFVLLTRLEEVIKTNQRYATQNSRLINSEGQLYELRNKIRRLAGLSQSLDHLWQIKQAEYHNINLLLKQFKE